VWISIVAVVASEGVDVVAHGRFVGIFRIEPGLNVPVKITVDERSGLPLYLVPDEWMAVIFWARGVRPAPELVQDPAFRSLFEPYNVRAFLRFFDVRLLTSAEAMALAVMGSKAYESPFMAERNVLEDEEYWERITEAYNRMVRERPYPMDWMTMTNVYVPTNVPAVAMVLSYEQWHPLFATRDLWWAGDPIVPQYAV